ncbi:MAG: patatin-like phospholipase family protein [Bacteroidota bacterium]
MYDILALDGGGSWALIQLLTLKERYKDAFPDLRGHDILAQFDLVIANSGGSIVLAALAENKTVDEALELFNDRAIRESIFTRNGFRDSFWPASISRWFGFGPKYSSKAKGDAFAQLFPKTHKVTMDQIPKSIGKENLKLVVCTYDALNNRAKFFRSYHSEGRQPEFVSLTRAVHGSSNAPIQYFDFPARFKAQGSNVYYELWDGALGGFNNPVAAGLIEAHKLGIPMDQVRVVSLGTGNRLMSMEEKERFYQVKQIAMRNRRKKLKFWTYGHQTEYFKRTVLNQAKTILYQPPDWANYVAKAFLSVGCQQVEEDQLLRFSPMIHVDSHTDSEVVALLNALYKMDMDLTQEADIRRVEACFARWREGKIKNQPIEYYVERDNDLVYLYGDTYFKEAMDKWKNRGK